MKPLFAIDPGEQLVAYKAGSMALPPVEDAFNRRIIQSDVVSEDAAMQLAILILIIVAMFAVGTLIPASHEITFRR